MYLYSDELWEETELYSSVAFAAESGLNVNDTSVQKAQGLFSWTCTSPRIGGYTDLLQLRLIFLFLLLPCEHININMHSKLVYLFEFWRIREQLCLEERPAGAVISTRAIQKWEWWKIKYIRRACFFTVDSWRSLGPRFTYGITRGVVKGNPQRRKWALRQYDRSSRHSGDINKPELIISYISKYDCVLL